MARGGQVGRWAQPRRISCYPHIQLPLPTSRMTSDKGDEGGRPFTLELPQQVLSPPYRNKAGMENEQALTKAAMFPNQNLHPLQ